MVNRQTRSRQMGQMDRMHEWAATTMLEASATVIVMVVCSSDHPDRLDSSSGVYQRHYSGWRQWWLGSVSPKNSGIDRLSPELVGLFPASGKAESVGSGFVAINEKKLLDMETKPVVSGLGRTTASKLGVVTASSFLLSPAGYSRRFFGGGSLQKCRGTWRGGNGSAVDVKSKTVVALVGRWPAPKLASFPCFMLQRGVSKQDSSAYSGYYLIVS